MSSFLTIEHLFNELVSFVEESRNGSLQLMSTMSDIKALAGTIQSSHADLQTQIAAIKKAVDDELKNLAVAMENNNQTQLDAVMAVLTAIHGQVQTMATNATAIQGELTAAIAAVPMPPSSAG